MNECRVKCPAFLMSNVFASPMNFHFLHSLPVFFLVLAFTPLLAAAERANPSLEAALAWIKRVDENFKEPRFSHLNLETLKTLSEINLGGHRKSDNKHVFIPPAEFVHLRALPALQKATLWEIDGLTDEALVHIGQVLKLRELELGDAQISGAGLKHLRRLKSLTFLGLGWTKDVGDTGMPHLTTLTRLEVLVLSGTKVTDTGLGPLAKLKKLRELRLEEMSQITDAGLLRLTL